MLDSCVPEFASHGFDRPPSGSTISGCVTLFFFVTYTQVNTLHPSHAGASVAVMTT